MQLILRSETRYFSKGSIIADYREDSKGLMVITSGKVRHPMHQGRIVLCFQVCKLCCNTMLCAELQGLCRTTSTWHGGSLTWVLVLADCVRLGLRFPWIPTRRTKRTSRKIQKRSSTFLSAGNLDPPDSSFPPEFCPSTKTMNCCSGHTIPQRPKF